MNRLIATAALILGLAAAAPSFAAPVTATLAAPVAKTTELIVGNAMWRCADTTCTLTTSPGDVDLVLSCRQIAHKVGAVTALAALPADRIAACNKPR